MAKFLIIRFSSIGDIVLTSPVVRCLKQQMPDAEVHFITKQSFASILESNPYIDKVISIKKEVKEQADLLKKEGYDYIIDLHNNIRSLQIKRLVKAKSYTFDKINFAKWLIVNFKINKLPNVHIVDRYMATLRELGVKYDGQGLDYFIPEGQEIDIEERFPRAKDGFFAFAIGAAHATKRLPKEKIIEICQKAPLPIILLGGPSEQEEGAEISEKSGRHTINACGKVSLHGSASIVRQSKALITHDTGMMHIGAALKKEIVSIWGNTIPEFGMYPFFPEDTDKNHSIEVKNLPCRPCSKIGYNACPKKHFNCMQKQSSDKICTLLSGIV